MSRIISIKKFKDHRGILSVIEKEIPFKVKRVFVLSNLNKKKKRGGHAHKKTKLALLAVNGSCDVIIKKLKKKKVFKLNTQDKILYIKPNDWHELNNFKKNVTIIVLASKNFDKKDYVY